MDVEQASTSGKPAFLNTQSTAQVTGECMFGRKKKDKDVVGVACPYCEYNNPLGAVTCEQCYYDLNKSARDQPMAEPTTSGEEIMSLLLGENEEDEDDVLEIVEAVLSVDDVTVEVDQYAVPETTTEEENKTNETFEFIGSQGPTLSQTVVAVEEEDDIALTTDDAPKEYVEFELDRVDPLAQVAEPVHTGKGGSIPPLSQHPMMTISWARLAPPPLKALPNFPTFPKTNPLGENLAQAAATETPELPDFAEAATSSSMQAADHETVSTPALPDLPEDDELAFRTNGTRIGRRRPDPSGQQDRIWPWPKAEAWTATQVYQEVVSAMEHIKHGRMEQAANTLDGLGHTWMKSRHVAAYFGVDATPRCDTFAPSNRTLDMAAYVHPAMPMCSKHERNCSPRRTTVCQRRPKSSWMRSSCSNLLQAGVLVSMFEAYQEDAEAAQAACPGGPTTMFAVNSVTCCTTLNLNGTDKLHFWSVHTCQDSNTDRAGWPW